MQIHKTITIFILFLSFNTFAQNTISKDKTLPMVGYWHIRASRNINILKQKNFNLEDDKDTLKNNYKAKWKVVDSTAKNYTIHFTVSQFNFSALNDSFNQLLNEILPTLTFKYQTNELGVFDSILNLKEIRETLSHSRDKISSVTSPFRYKTDKASKNYRFLNVALELLLEYEITQDIKKIHHFYGLQYKKNTAYTYDTTLIDPNSFRFFKAKSIYKLTNTYPNIDKVKFTCLTNSYKEINKRTINKKAQRELKKSGEFSGSRKKGKISILNTNESEISILEGYPISIKFISLTNSKSITTSETITITFAP